MSPRGEREGQGHPPQESRSSTGYKGIGGPPAAVSATWVKRLLAKDGGGVVGAFRDIVVDIASETAKKTLGL